MPEKYLHKKNIALAAIFFAIFIVSGFWLFRFVKSAKSDEANNSSVPLPTASSVNPLYEKILNSHTLSNFPPNNYFPLSSIPLNNDDLDISARAYAVMDRDSRELLYAKNPTERLPIASIAKIMTAVITLENVSLDNLFTVSPEVTKIGEASMGLTSGERLTASELLYGLMLPSGNDAAETLAEGAGISYLTKNNLDVDRKKGREWFMNAMNKKAQSLGMLDTYFFNPTGLDEDMRETTTFSSALDLLALTNYALNNTMFAKIAGTKNIDIPYKEDFHKAFPLYNILNLDGTFKGIRGVKPGNSVFAKETLVSYAERDGRRIIIVILGSDYTKDDVLKIYKRIFNAGR